MIADLSIINLNNRLRDSNRRTNTKTGDDLITSGQFGERHKKKDKKVQKVKKGDCQL